MATASSSKSDVEIVLDSREMFLKDEFNKSNNQSFVVEQLAVGDIVFRNKQTGDILLICERKTMSDLYGSIISGRYREQRERLLETKLKICYILEDFVDEKQSPLFYKDKSESSRKKKLAVISGAIENLAIYHNICIIPSVSVSHTAKMMENIRMKLEKKQPTTTAAAESEPATTSTLPTKRVKVMHNVFMNQLLVITGVSDSVAHAITEYYESVKQLTDAYAQQENEAEKEMMLADIKIGKRKLGPVLSRRIYEVYNK